MPGFSMSCRVKENQRKTGSRVGGVTMETAIDITGVIICSHRCGRNQGGEPGSQ